MYALLNKLNGNFQWFNEYSIWTMKFMSRWLLLSTYCRLDKNDFGSPFKRIIKGWTLIKFHKICIHYSVIYTKQLFYTFYTTYSTAVIEKTIEFHFDIRFNKNQIQLQSEWNRTKYHKKQLSISRDVDDITSAFVLNPKFYKEHRNVA